MARHLVSHRVIRRLRDTRGGSLIEAALITPLLLMLTFGIIDFASMFYVYLALENGVSQATRYGVTGNLKDDPSNPGTALNRAESMKLAMRQATPTLTIPDSAFTFSNMPPGGSSWSPGVGGPGALEKVTVDYTWSFLTPLIRPFFPGGQLAIRVESSMKNEERFN
jgi:Flp pilus assembly protein TadG